MSFKSLIIIIILITHYLSISCSLSSIMGFICSHAPVHIFTETQLEHNSVAQTVCSRFRAALRFIPSSWSSSAESGAGSAGSAFCSSASVRSIFPCREKREQVQVGSLIERGVLGLSMRKCRTSSMKTGSGSTLVSRLVSSGVAAFSTNVTVEEKFN